jgi:hypothetical protein
MSDNIKMALKETGFIDKKWMEPADFDISCVECSVSVATVLVNLCLSQLTQGTKLVFQHIKVYAYFKPLSYTEIW